MLMRSNGEKLFAFFNGLFMLILSLTMIIPLLAVLKDSLDLAPRGVTLSFIPREPTIMYYRMVFKDVGVYRPFLNSIFVTAVGTVLALVLNALGAYTMSRKEIRGTKFFVYFMVIIPMVFGGGGIIANYMWFKAIGILNSYFVLFVPTLAMGFWMIIIRQYYLTIPFSLTESAWLDGASEYLIYRKIIAPLSKSVFAAMALFVGVGYWNQWLQALYYVHNPKFYTFPIKLRGMLFYGQDSEAQMRELAMSLGIDPEEVLLAFEGLSSSMIVVSIIPVLIAYPYLQRHFASGVRVGAIKG